MSSKTTADSSQFLPPPATHRRLIPRNSKSVLTKPPTKRTATDPLDSTDPKTSAHLLMSTATTWKTKISTTARTSLLIQLLKLGPLGTTTCSLFRYQMPATPKPLKVLCASQARSTTPLLQQIHLTPTRPKTPIRMRSSVCSLSRNYSPKTTSTSQVRSRWDLPHWSNHLYSAAVKQQTVQKLPNSPSRRMDYFARIIASRMAQVI